MKRQNDFVSVLFAGAAAGAIATVVMTQFQNAWSKASEALSSDQTQAGDTKPSDEPATVKIAEKVAHTVGIDSLSDEQKKLAGPTVHYGFGTAMGALYAGMSNVVPATKVGRGAGFGTALFFGADEIAVPLLGLSKGPTETPVSIHAYAWISHLVYGMTLDLALATMLAMMSSRPSKRKALKSALMYGSKAAA